MISDELAEISRRIKGLINRVSHDDGLQLLRAMQQINEVKTRLKGDPVQPVPDTLAKHRNVDGGR